MSPGEHIICVRFVSSWVLFFYNYYCYSVNILIRVLWCIMLIYHKITISPFSIYIFSILYLLSSFKLKCTALGREMAIKKKPEIEISVCVCVVSGQIVMVIFICGKIAVQTLFLAGCNLRSLPKTPLLHYCTVLIYNSTRLVNNCHAAQKKNHWMTFVLHSDIFCFTISNY